MSAPRSVPRSLDDPELRLSQAADRDYKDILNWSEDEFGQAAMERYDALLEAALLHAARRRDGIGFRQRPELCAGVVSWHPKHWRQGQEPSPRAVLPLGR